MKHEKHMQKEIDRKVPSRSPISVVLRAYRPSDCSEVLRLFYDTVHTVNARDYTEEQLDAWADGKPDAAKWNKSLCAHFSLAAEADGILAGFGDIDETGYLDRLYVHRDFQGMGVGTALCQALEQEAARAVRQAKPDASVCITTHASITARPFFEARGYRVQREQQVERKGVLLTNYIYGKTSLEREGTHEPRLSCQ